MKHKEILEQYLFSLAFFEAIEYERFSRKAAEEGSLNIFLSFSSKSTPVYDSNTDIIKTKTRPTSQVWPRELKDSDFGCA